MALSRRLFLRFLALLGLGRSVHTTRGAEGADPERPFGDEFPKLDSWTIGEWWKRPAPKGRNPQAASNDIANVPKKRPSLDPATKHRRSIRR